MGNIKAVAKSNQNSAGKVKKSTIQVLVVQETCAIAISPAQALLCF